MKPRLSHQVKALRDGGGMDRELDAEVRFHIEMETENYIRQGMDPVAARTRAIRNFGPMEKHKEEARDARGVSSFEQLIQDLKYGARTLVKNPGFALLAVMTLGLGIGANTAIFSVINGVLLKPLPYENGDRLVLIQQSDAAGPAAELSACRSPSSTTTAQQLASFDGIVEFHQMNFDLLRRGEPDRVATGVVSPNFFDVLGIKPLLGRTFVDTDDDEGRGCGAGPRSRLLADEVRRRSRHHRAGLRDERPAAHGGRRAAARCRTIRTKSTCTCRPRHVRSARAAETLDHQNRRRVLSAPGVRAAQAERVAGDGRRGSGDGGRALQAATIRTSTVRTTRLPGENRRTSSSS